MTHRINLVERAQAAIFCAGQLLKNEFDADGVFGNRLLQNHFFATWQRDFQERVGQPNFFDAALRQHGVFVHIEQFIFNRRTSAVQNKNFHSLVYKVRKCES